MNEQRVRIHLRAQLKTGLHITGPGRSVATVDRPIELDAAGFPLIPATTIRGRLRVHLERLLRAYGQPVCLPPTAAQMCPHYAWGEQPPSERYCLACRLFGSPWLEAGLISEDLRLVERQRGASSLLRMERTGVSISRRLGTARGERLFSTETTIPALDGEALCFEGYIHGWTRRADVGWLLGAVRLISHIGGVKARGLGALQIEVPSVEWWAGEEQTWQSRETVNSLIEEALGHDAE